jgi:DNA-binding transcriptional MerR regulator
MYKDRKNMETVKDRHVINVEHPMSEDLMSIRQMCDNFEVTARTLRFYEAKELLAPIREGQKRLFTKRDRGRLKLILRGKRFGFSLEEIRQLLDLYDRDDKQKTQLERTHTLAITHLDNLTRQRELLDEAIHDLKDQLSWMQDKITSLDQNS